MKNSFAKLIRLFLVLVIVIFSALYLFPVIFPSIKPFPLPSPAHPPTSSPPPADIVSINPTPTSFPSKHLIKTTFIPQAPQKNWDQPWQDACEEAALLTVAFYYQNQQPSQEEIASSILAMIDYETSQGFKKDVNIDQMALIATDYLHLKTEIILQPDLNKIKSYLIRNIPVIIPANGKQLFTENHYFTNGGPYYHNLIILGYDDKKEQFTVHDVGTRHGAYFKYSYNLLLDSIHDFPSSGHKEDISQGDKKALILLK